jgi:hypothetical protein
MESKMSELRELTGRELDAVGGGFLDNFAQNLLQNNGAGVVGAQIGQQFSVASLNGIITFNF